MDWYQHSTGSHDDPDISDAIDEFGPAGYSVFFITLEIYGTEYNHVNSEGWLTISQTFLRRKLRISSTKAEQILNFYSERQRIMIKVEKNSISINCPKFIEIASNWTKRKKPLPTEGLQRDNVVPTAKEEKKKRRRREEEKINRTVFQIPSLEEIKAYCLERKNNIDPQLFLDKYIGNGWMVGKNKMKDWKAVIRTWEKNDFGGNGNGTGKQFNTSQRTFRSERDAQTDRAGEVVERILAEHKAKNPSADGDPKKEPTADHG